MIVGRRLTSVRSAFAINVRRFPTQAMRRLD
jgi:hypothetical protein